MAGGHTVRECRALIDGWDGAWIVTPDAWAPRDDKASAVVDHGEELVRYGMEYLNASERTESLVEGAEYG